MRSLSLMRNCLPGPDSLPLAHILTLQPEGETSIYICALKFVDNPCCPFVEGAFLGQSIVEINATAPIAAIASAQLECGLRLKARSSDLSARSSSSSWRILMVLASSPRKNASSDRTIAVEQLLSDGVVSKV